MSTPLARAAQSSGVHVVFAFIAMGGWAVFANRAHAMPAPLLAGLVQGGLSAAITLFLKRLIEAVAARFSGIAALMAPPAIACAVTAGLLKLIHMLAGTPPVVTTIIVTRSVAHTDS